MAQSKYSHSEINALGIENNRPSKIRTPAGQALLHLAPYPASRGHSGDTWVQSAWLQLARPLPCVGSAEVLHFCHLQLLRVAPASLASFPHSCAAISGSLLGLQGLPLKSRCKPLHCHKSCICISGKRMAHGCCPGLLSLETVAKPLGPWLQQTLDD